MGPRTERTRFNWIERRLLHGRRDRNSSRQWRHHSQKNVFRSDTYTHPNRNSNSNGHANGDTHPYCHTYTYADNNANSYSNADRNTNDHANTDSYCYPHSYGDAYAYAYTQRNPDSFSPGKAHSQGPTHAAIATDARALPRGEKETRMKNPENAGIVMRMRLDDSLDRIRWFSRKRIQI